MYYVKRALRQMTTYKEVPQNIISSNFGDMDNLVPSLMLAYLIIKIFYYVLPIPLYNIRLFIPQ